MIHASIAGLGTLQNVSFNIERSGGCTTFECTVSSGTRKPVQGETINIWNNATLVYSGSVVTINGSELTGWSISGRNTTLSRHVLSSGLRLPPLSEAKTWPILRSAISKFFPGADFSFVPGTSQIGEVDLGGKTVEQAMREFERATDTPFVWGVNGDNQFYVRNVDNGKSIVLQQAIQWTRRAKEVPSYRYIRFISTGQQKFPPLFDNSQLRSLESHPSKVNFSELNAWSTLQTNGVYNDSLGTGLDGDPKFDLVSGASLQLRPTGTKAYELDHIGERIELNTIAQQYFYTVPGQRYCVRFFTQGEPLINPTSLQVEYIFDGVATFGQVFTVDSTAEIEHRFYFTAPAGATTSTLRFTKGDGLEGTDRGFFVYAIRMFRDDTPYPDGWDLVVLNPPDAVVDYGIREESSLYVKSSLPLAATANRWVSLRRKEPSQISRSIIYKWVVELKAVTGEPWPQFQVVVEFFKQDGTFASLYQSPVINIAAPVDYTQINNAFKSPDDAESATVSLRQLTNGAFVCRTFVVRDLRDTAPIVYGDTLEFTHDSGNLSSQETVVLSEDAETYEDALKIIDGWKKIHDGPDPLSIENELTLFDIRQNLRIVEEDRRYSIESMTHNLGAMRTTVQLGEKERSLEDVLGRIRKSSSSI